MMAIDDYRFDAYGRPVHKDLDVLANEITAALDMAASLGHKLQCYYVPLERYGHLANEQAYFNGGGQVSYGDCDKMNFIWRGVAVCPTEN